MHRHQCWRFLFLLLFSLHILFKWNTLGVVINFDVSSSFFFSPHTSFLSEMLCASSSMLTIPLPSSFLVTHHLLSVRLHVSSAIFPFCNLCYWNSLRSSFERTRNILPGRFPLVYTCFIRFLMQSLLSSSNWSFFSFQTYWRFSDWVFQWLCCSFFLIRHNIWWWGSSFRVWRMWGILTLPLLTSLLWPTIVVVPVRVPSVCQIELFNLLLGFIF